MADSKIILTKSVPNLGREGDIVTVKAGYARNYLIPQGYAIKWTRRADAQANSMMRARLARAAASRADAVAIKDIIEGMTVEIPAKVSESGKLFGGISADKIAAALAGKATVEPKNITVETIKTTGEFPATIALHPEIDANIIVKVIAE